MKYPRPGVCAVVMDEGRNRAVLIAGEDAWELPHEELRGGHDWRQTLDALFARLTGASSPPRARLFAIHAGRLGDSDLPRAMACFVATHSGALREGEWVPLETIAERGFTDTESRVLFERALNLGAAERIDPVEIGIEQ